LASLTGGFHRGAPLLRYRHFRTRHGAFWKGLPTIEVDRSDREGANSKGSVAR
jgi:hypothetical protein